MKYFKLAVRGSADEKLACIATEPTELGIKDYCMAQGERIGDDYPDQVTMRLDDYPGFKLCSLLGNILSYLIVDTVMKVCIEKSSIGEIEFLPFTLLNHKGIVHSTDYWIINPIGSVDVLDMEKSQFRRGRRTGEIVGISEVVFNKDKLKNAPDLFRVPQELPAYYISENLASCWKEEKCSNIFLSEISVS